MRITLELAVAIACISFAMALMWLALPGNLLNAWLLRKPVAEASFPILVLASFVVGLILFCNLVAKSL